MGLRVLTSTSTELGNSNLGGRVGLPSSWSVAQAREAHVIAIRVANAPPRVNNSNGTNAVRNHPS
jgi:hypothetical protein